MKTCIIENCEKKVSKPEFDYCYQCFRQRVFAPHGSGKAKCRDCGIILDKKEMGRGILFAHSYNTIGLCKECYDKQPPSDAD